MKHFNKALAAVFLAASVSMTSCVDNEVSPEVKQLRETQVAYLQAKADLEAARAQREVIQNEYSAAMNAIQIQSSEANLAADLASINVQVKEAEAELKEAEIEFAEAVLELEVYLAGQNNEKAEEYLNEYSNAAGILSMNAGLQIQKQAELAKAQMILASANAPWTVQKEILEGDLAKESANLTAEQAALAALEAVAADPATSIEEAKSLRAQISDLENKNYALDVEVTKADQAVTEAYNKVDAAEDAIDEYIDDQDDLKSINDDLTAANEGKANIEAQIAVETARLAAFNTVLTNSKAALTPLETIYNTKKADSDAKLNAYTIAEVNLTIAQNNDAANSTPETQAAVTDATTARDEALTAYNDAWNEYSDADADRTTALNQVTSAQNDVDNQQNWIDNLNNSLTSQITNISDLNVNKTAKEAEIAAGLAAYNDAVANLEAYKIDADVKDEAYDVLWNQYWENNTMASNMWDVVNVIENYLDNINEAIEDKKGDIANTKSDIQSIEEDIANESINMADQEKTVAALEAELAKLESEIAAQEALVTKWKALLDAALAG